MDAGTIVMLGGCTRGLDAATAEALHQHWTALGFDAWWGCPLPVRSSDHLVCWGRLIAATPHLNGHPGDPGPYVWEEAHPHEPYPGADSAWSLTPADYAATLADVEARLKAAGHTHPAVLAMVHLIEWESRGTLVAAPLALREPEPTGQVEASDGARLVQELVRLEWLELVDGATSADLARRIPANPTAEQLDAVLLDAPEVDDVFCTVDHLETLLAAW